MERFSPFRPGCGLWKEGENGLKTVDFELNGRTHHLILNGAALFDAYDKFGDKGDLLDRLTGTGRQSFDDTVWWLVKLAQQGEAVRRWEGEEPQPMLTAEEALRTLRPVDVVRARAAIRAAYALGFEREEQSEDAEIDLGLMELQKKTGPGLDGRSGSASRVGFWASLRGRG